MRRFFGLFIVTFFISASLPRLTHAVDCSSPPAGLGASWAYQFRNWCLACGGTFYDGPRCEPGSNWGGRQSAPPTISPSYTPPPDYEAERRRQEENRKLKAEYEAEKQRKQEEFDDAKKKTMKILKGIDSGDPGLKGAGKDTGHGLKGVTEPAPHKDPAVVDLRHLDPNRPITVDPNVVKGNERKIPVQISEKTLQNENYRKGIDAIIAGDPSAAVQYFKKTLTQLPDDLLVKNALAFAEDLAKLRVGKTKENLARSEANKGITALYEGDYITSIKLLESAIKLDPNEKTYRQDLASVKKMKEATALRFHLEEQAEKRALLDKKHHELASNTLMAIQRSDFGTALLILEEMLSAEPDNKNLTELTVAVRGWRAEALARNKVTK